MNKKHSYIPTYIKQNHKKTNSLMTKARPYSSNVQHKKSEIDRFIMNHHRIGMDGGIGKV